MIHTLIEKRAAVFTFAILVLIVGTLAYINLPRENTPEIKQPWIFVTTVYPGVPPKDVETLVTIPLEEELENINGVTKISSSSYMSVSSIFVEFGSDVDTETALRRVKDRVDTAKASLPDDVQETAVQELNSSDWPIFIVSFAHDRGVAEIDADVTVLKDRLKRVKGVLDVSVAGNIERTVTIELDPHRLAHFGISIEDVKNAVRSENTSIPGGVLEGESLNFNLSVTGEITDPAGFAHIMVPNGPVSVRLGDLGTAAFREAAQESFSRLNGRPAISLEVKKRTGANLIDLADSLKAEIEAADLPEGTEVVYTYDESRFIKETISDLENNMFSGFVLVLLITVFFLGFRNAMFVSLAIPFSMLISFFVLQMMGVTLNMVVLFSLIMALGMLVDNGIVIVENIFRHASMGKERAAAAADGTREVAGPILASTITTCLAFFPIIFMPGIMGEFMKYLPITIIVVLASSLFVALTINPVFCASFMGLSEKDARKISGGQKDGGKMTVFGRVQAVYEKVLGWSVKRPFVVIFSSAGVVVLGLILYGFFGKEPVFFPESDPSTAIIRIETRTGTPLQETDRIVRDIETVIPDIDMSMDSYKVTVGENGADESHRATIRVEYKPYLDRTIPGVTATERIKKALKGKYPEAKITFEEQEDGPPSGHPVSYRIEGADYGTMGGISDRIIDILTPYAELKGIFSDYEAPKPELAVTVDRKKAAWFGVSTVQIASAVRNAF
ncbi:MAG: efflux RND transporter permease subunit, partial [Spirochaetales bacterium]|nr:efflux RND transporter permease subunit [Spirochaetales bacterium]